MEFIIENSGQISTGQETDVIQFPNTSAEVFNLNSGLLERKAIAELNGDFETPVITAIGNTSPNTNISNLTLKSLGGFGGIGCYKSDNKHRLILYEYEELSRTIADLEELGW